ncbi:centromere-associated protein E isoform X4 [Danio aesculapii]|uniref:centromere-associated protein E isoform X4 n=1 Tax=Danio aesculapii TaxID=1142201 RepID=UPI0024BF2E9D|nr:centromere-associated protein E isoform X4 [Danio aesculapii]
MTEESAVKVCVRVRPLIKREASESSEPVQLYWRSDKQAIHQLDEDGAQTKSYSFDRVFSAAESTAQLYQDIAKPLVVSAVEGYNGTIFAYGQTSSGKTFTMMGSEHNPGVIPLAMADVFKTIKSFPKKEFLLRVSYMEIYNETVTDLLCDSWKRKPLEIREGNYKNVYVADLTEELVTSPEQALSWITKGEKNRHYGKTKMNQRSSRSHTIFRMILESRERSDPTAGENADGAIIVSHLNLVDLAGAERASQTGAEGTRFKEGCNINRSLFTLGQVIKKLSDESQKGFLNYRDSKLTRILQNSLGGNAKTVIICTITPATVDETVSTLQFASAAKRMKNDPHVTEVSDEGALLRRYRNEIVDLKRRLQEVSSVTQTTATERESLCQLLQEKDQLQREQEDRIKNLTKLLVTSSNIALIPKVPKRRVTWGGKLLRSAHLLNEDLCSTDMSFAEPYLKKRRADCSLADVGEDMDEFDSRFDFTALEEPNVDMEMSSITVRSSSEGSHFLDSPRASELMQKVSSLESQLEAETQSKQTAEEMNAELQMKLSHLQNILEAQSAPSREEINTISELEKQMEEMQRRLETEVQERQTAEEKNISLELKVAELEKPSEELLHTQNTCERVKKDLEEAIQLCETVSFEKDAVIAERDMIKHSLDMTTEELETLKAEKDSLQKEKEALQKDKDTLQKDIEERRDADEFEKLEEESKRDYERELEAENCRLEKDLKQSEDMIQKLKADLALMSSELQKKTDLTTELQSFSGKDIVQEVTRLRRSLDDAETLSLETKKEWAFLRSENISLKERDATLTTDYGKMEVEVKMLQDRLEQEKSRFKKMQTDLQKELMGAFDENTKLTALMDGKVPKNLTDNVVLEKTVSDLHKELDQIREREQSLQNKLSELETLPAKVDELLGQVCVMSEELRCVREERDAVCSAQASVNEAHQRLTEDYSTAQHQLLQMESDLLEAQLKETQLSQELSDNTQQLHNLQTENDTLHTSLQEAQQKCEQLSADMGSVCAERDQLLSEKMEGESEELQNLRNTISSITEEKQQMQEILQSLREQRDQLKADLEESNGLLMQAQMEHSGPQIDTQHDELLQQIQQLRVELDTANEEKNQLKSDLQENVEMTIENQEELRAALDKVKDLQKSLEELETKQQESEHKSQQDLQMQQLREELESVCCERERLLSGRLPNTDAEQMKADITSLKEEREQLQHTLQELRDQLMQTEQTVVQLRADLESVCAERERLLTEKSTDVEEMEKVSCRLTEEKEMLQQTIQQLTDQREQLRRDLEESQDTVLQLRADLESVCAEREHRLMEEKEMLQQTIQQLTDQSEQLRRDLEESQDMVLQLRADVESACAEKERLLTERDQDLASITEEREQLLDLLKANREEKNQLRTDLEENQENLLHLREELESLSAEMSREQQERLQEMKTAEEKLSAVTVERDQLMERNTEHNQTIVQLRADLQSACAERDSLMVERDQSSSSSALSDGGDLQEILQGVRELIQVQGELKQKKHQLSDPLSPTDKQKAQLQQLQCLTAEMESLRNQRIVLRKDLEDAAATSKMYQELLHVSKEELKQQQKENTELMEQSSARETQLQQQLNELNEDLTALKVLRDQHDTEIQSLRSELRSLSREKEDLLEKSRAEGDLLRRDLQTLQDQLEETPTEQLLQSVTEERDQLRRELQGKMEKLTHIETKAEQLEKQKILLESEVHSLSQSLSEVNCSVSPDQNNTQSKHMIMAELEASEERLQTAFAELQQIMERPVDQLSDVNREEWAVLYQLVPFIPKDRRNTTHTKKTTRLNHVIIKIAEAYQRLAQRFHTHFQTELQRDVCCFQESRLQDLLLCLSPAPSQSLRMLQDDFQQLWEQRLSHLLEKRQQYLQKLECVLVLLEEGLSRYAEMLSEERQHRTEELQELKTLLRSAHADAVIQLLEKQISRRDKAAECLNTYYFVLLNKYDSEINPLKFSSSESERRLEDQRKQTLTLLKAQNGTLPKTEAELLQDNQRLSLQLQQTHRHVEEIQEQMKELQVKTDASNQKQHEDLQELRVQLMEKQSLVQSLEDKLRRSEALVKSSMTPAAAELAALKDKLVKMELEHIAVTTSHEKEISQMSSMLEHRGDVIRKLKETLRKQQQDDEQSFTDRDEFELKMSTRANTTLKEKKMEDLQKKNAQFESLVSKQQEEISKWKRRAYKMKESKRDAPCTPTKRDAPHTPTKRHPALAETEVNSPKRSVLDSPKSRFFDLRSSVPLSLSHHTQFFDNSSLGTVPEVSCTPADPAAAAAVDSSDSDDEDCSSNAAVMSNAAHKDDWWQIPDASPTKTDANACPTQ